MNHVSLPLEKPKGAGLLRIAAGDQELHIYPLSIKLMPGETASFRWTKKYGWRRIQEKPGFSFKCRA